MLIVQNVLLGNILNPLILILFKIANSALLTSILPLLEVQVVNIVLVVGLFLQIKQIVILVRMENIPKIMCVQFVLIIMFQSMATNIALFVILKKDLSPTSTELNAICPPVSGSKLPGQIIG